ncbi:MAG: hypothetical protein IPN70_01165 [Candidatus Moraniibacteriota bacterium]|nr:MAG: hypothetical protein IPN70_01165 [Candidatus Moranbacteria bacterium]
MRKLFQKIFQFFISLKKYISKEYKWIIAILIAIPSVIVTIQSIQFKKTSESFFYVPELIDNAKFESLEEVECLGSIASLRGDSLRCFSNKYIYDPCFEDASNFTTVTCPNHPEDKNPIILAVKDVEYRNQNGENFKNQVPWYVVMHDGSTCRMITGTSIVVADRRFDYSCSNGNTYDLILPLKEMGEKLYMDCTRNGRIVEDCLIKEVWF